MTNGSHVAPSSAPISATETRDQFTILMQALSDITTVMLALNQKVDKMTTSNQDVMNAISGIATGQVALGTAITGAIADMGAGGDAARAAAVTALQAVAATMATQQKEILDAIAAQTPPAVMTTTP